jgi:paraquat-inducible protein B
VFLFFLVQKQQIPNKKKKITANKKLLGMSDRTNSICISDTQDELEALDNPATWMSRQMYQMQQVIRELQDQVVSLASMVADKHEKEASCDMERPRETKHAESISPMKSLDTPEKNQDSVQNERDDATENPDPDEGLFDSEDEMPLSF